MIVVPAAAGEDLGTIGNAVVEIMDAIGGPGVGLLLAVEAIFPPIPSEIVLPLAGFAANQGHLSLAGALVWSTIGSLVGALVLYGAGHHFGRDRVLRVWLRLPLVDEHGFVRTEAWFARHGEKAVFYGRMAAVRRGGRRRRGICVVARGAHPAEPVPRDAVAGLISGVRVRQSVRSPVMSRSGTPSWSLSSASGEEVRLCRHHS